MFVNFIEKIWIIKKKCYFTIYYVFHKKKGVTIIDYSTNKINNYGNL